MSGKKSYMPWMAFANQADTIFLKQLKNVLKALSTSITQPRDPTLTVPDNESLDGSQQNVQHQGALP